MWTLEFIVDEVSQGKSDIKGLKVCKGEGKIGVLEIIEDCKELIFW